MSLRSSVKYLNTKTAWDSNVSEDPVGRLIVAVPHGKIMKILFMHQ